MRAYYSATLKDFISESDDSILGKLSGAHSNRTLEIQQTNAWKSQITLLKDAFRNKNENGHIFFEFSIPRMGKRVDNIIIIADLIFVVEFKVGDSEYGKHAIDQVIDYSLDLKNFHQGSHNKKLIPILVSTHAKSTENVLEKYRDLLYKPLLTNKEDFFEVLFSCFSEKGNNNIDSEAWSESLYKPTPTIIEAAQALYLGHDVKEISRSDSGAVNLSKTSDCINQIINHSKKNKKKSICFITGVPGAGKTLAGLNIANERTKVADDENAVFLSGNGPLVDVLREALTRDKVQQVRDEGEKISKKDAERSTKKFIQNIHHFRDDALKSQSAPDEKVVIFDEAQRSWNKEQVSSFMSRKKGILDFNRSEPQFLIEVMNRHQDWSSIICLIGGGQEIHDGEGGLQEWISAIKNNFPDWNIYYSDLITSDSDYLDDVTTKNWLIENAVAKKDLHLATNLRSFRSEKLSEFIHYLLIKDLNNSKKIYLEIKKEYPIFLTRNLDLAKKWIKNISRGSERFGLIASSNARRLKPFAVNVRNEIDSANWFLNSKEDVRSSYYLEDVATEFDIQGLEIDWSIVCWGADFYLTNGDWSFQTFKGTKWQNVNKIIKKKYLLNTYRVLLTRSRQGFVIFIPEGAVNDSTRSKDFYDGTFNYLANEVGIDLL